MPSVVIDLDVNVTKAVGSELLCFVPAPITSGLFAVVTNNGPDAVTFKTNDGSDQNADPDILLHSGDTTNVSKTVKTNLKLDLSAGNSKCTVSLRVPGTSALRVTGTNDVIITNITVLP